MKMKEYEETDYDIPRNEAVCYEEDCTCRYVYATKSNEVLITYCSNRQLGSHLWLDTPLHQWASISPISQETHKTSIVLGEPIMKEIKIKNLERNLH